MKRAFFSLLFSFLSVFSFSQIAFISKNLKQKVNSSTNTELHRIVVELKDKIDFDLVRNNGSINAMPLDKRAKTIIQLLQEKAYNTQELLLADAYLNSKSSSIDFEVVKKYWIVNIMVLDANNAMIHFLKNNCNVKSIDLDSSTMLKPTDDIQVNSLNNKKSINLPEAGLFAINADKLWALGYTGQNRKLLSVDTGVWTSHPAVKNRFLGNYLPIEQCWLPYDSEIPADKTGSHGTHTIGTMLGLDASNNDTIGVAMNAYFMSSDPIATSMATVKPLSVILQSFEWAMNPDGDTATTNDIPDVINNSWGFDYVGDTTLCESYVVDLTEAMQAAGIAVVFAAGNEGPNPITIGYPQYVSTDLVNIFTVGALNANNVNLAIAGFSSRGPSSCQNLTGSILIKPEVCAPGVSVRSAIGTNGYDYYDGTSMASPHVSGCVLLLKEAFPYLSGEQILLALYYTAIDLGDIGEDNTYGNGMIDVFAAFNYLSQTYNPVPPISKNWDVKLQSVIQPESLFSCNETFSPIINIANLGDSLIDSLQIYYKIDNGIESSFLWSGLLYSGQKTNIQLPTITTIEGKHRLFIHIKFIDSTIVERDTINNRIVFPFNVLTKKTIPYFEGFENTSLSQTDWVINNPNIDLTWDTISTVGLLNSSKSAYINLIRYSPRSNQIDELISPIIQLSVDTPITLSFDLAYHFKHVLFTDTLNVFISNNCGASFTPIWQKYGASLNTTISTNQNFYPTSESDWRKHYVDLTEYAGQGGVILKFQTINRAGDNLFLDNITIDNSQNMKIDKIGASKFNVFPNPVNSNCIIESNCAYLLTVYNSFGQKVIEENCIESSKNIDMSRFNSGVYSFVFLLKEESKIIKIIKE